MFNLVQEILTMYSTPSLPPAVPPSETILSHSQARAKSKPDAILDSSPIVTISEATNWSQLILLKGSESLYPQ